VRLSIELHLAIHRSKPPHLFHSILELKKVKNCAKNGIVAQKLTSAGKQAEEIPLAVFKEFQYF
jgi:hypothetical protein